VSAQGDDGERAVAHVHGQGIQVGDGSRQHNQFGGAYIERKVIQPARPAPARIVVGGIPQAPPAFQPREDLLSQLRAAGPGISVVTAVTGMRGVGKTQVAAAYARECINEGCERRKCRKAGTRPAGGRRRGTASRLRQRS
jgi:hypothetical protein